MRPEKLQKFLASAFENRKTVLVVGEPGIGKSDVIDAAAAQVGARLMTKHPGVEDPTDAKGMPFVYATGGRQEAHFVPFNDLQALIDANKLTVCHLEDFGLAVPMTQGAYMQLLQRRSVNGHRISEHVVFVLSSNDVTHLSGVSGCLETIKSRCTIVKMETSLDDWCGWALDHNMPSELVAFIRFRPALLSDFKPSRGFQQSPNPRNWAEIGCWMNIGIRDLEVFTGRAGEGAAVEFYSFLDMYASLPSLDAILLDPTGAEVPQKPASLFAVASGLARKATPANFERVTTYTARLPKEFDVMAVKDCVRLNRAVTSCKGFVAWATRNSSVLL